jgi:NADPH-dependent glutamate synthase beta subunit-like oxidoreductase
MPAFAEEIEAADQEGIEIHTLVTPTRILSDKGHIAALECVRNELGEPDASGRRRPVPIPDSQFIVSLDTLVVAIGEDSGIDCIGPALQSGIETTSGNTVKVDYKTMLTNRPGVFAAGDVVTGPNTVVEAIAAGKKSAVMIARYLLKEDLAQPHVEQNIPQVYLAPVGTEDGLEPEVRRVETPRASVEWRKRNFAEVEVALSVTEARRESHRCLRCDVEFTKPKPVEPIRTEVVVGGKA